MSLIRTKSHLRLKFRMKRGRIEKVVEGGGECGEEGRNNGGVGEVERKGRNGGKSGLDRRMRRWRKGRGRMGKREGRRMVGKGTAGGWMNRRKNVECVVVAVVGIRRIWRELLRRG